MKNLCKYCKQSNNVNHELCRDFYKFVIVEKIKKTKKLLDMLLEELETIY